MRRFKNVLANILATLALALATSQVALYAWCKYQPGPVCRQEGLYWLVAVSTVLVVLGSFLLAQYQKTFQYFQPRRRAVPKPPGILNQTFKSFLWVDEEQDSEDDSKGWWVEFEDGVGVLVPRKEFYAWLLKVAAEQSRLENMQLARNKSALSMRANPGLSRRKWHAYVHLLNQAGVTYRVNSNIVALRAEYLWDVWSIVKLVEGKYVYVEVNG